MTPVDVDVMPPELLREPLPLNNKRGTLSFAFLIATEATLFAMMFATYWYLGKGKSHWPMDEPPKLMYAIPMLVILELSSGVMYWGEQQIKRMNIWKGKFALVVVQLMGLSFIVLSILEYLDEAKTFSPRLDAYGSIFYTAVTLHGAHLVLGLMMLTYVLLLPGIEPRRELPYRPYHNAALYWHFVDAMWIFIVLIFYGIPHIAGA